MEKSPLCGSVSHRARSYIVHQHTTSLRFVNQVLGYIYPLLLYHHYHHYHQKQHYDRHHRAGLTLRLTPTSASAFTYTSVRFTGATSSSIATRVRTSAGCLRLLSLGRKSLHSADRMAMPCSVLCAVCCLSRETLHLCSVSTGLGVSPGEKRRWNH